MLDGEWEDGLVNTRVRQGLVLLTVPLMQLLCSVVRSVLQPWLQIRTVVLLAVILHRQVPHTP
jgi:hypothetical protein